MASIPDTINANNARILKLLIAVPGTYNPRELHTGLILAAKLGFVECAMSLLDAGADKHYVNSTSYTPLQTAVQNNKIGVVNLLLKYNCDVNYIGGAKLTPLQIAAKNGHEEVLQALIARGAYLNARDNEGNTPLILASKYGNYSAMGTLLKAGCDVNAANVNGCTALHYACHRARGYKQLLEFGADPNVKDKESNTPLIMAAAEGFDQVVKVLVEYNCDVNVTNDTVKKTALHILAFKGHTESINTLVLGGAKIESRDLYDHSPLWYAIKNKKVGVVRLLLKAYSHVDMFTCKFTSESENCPVRLAFQLKLFDAVKFFILTGYDHHHLRDCIRSIEFSDWLQSNEEFSHWLEFADGAQTLKQMCRKWIRHYLGSHFYHDLNLLPLPQVLRDYLFLEELHEH